MKRFFLGIGIFFFLSLLVIFPESCVQGAKSGLLLWFQVIIPNLLPFLIVSSLIIELEFTDILYRFTYPIIGRILRISKIGCYPVVIGLLSGYPVGAKACGDLVRNKSLDPSEGQFLLAFCNNASPMFIISFIATEKLQITGSRKYLIWLLLILSGLASSLIFRKLHSFRKPHIRKRKNALVRQMSLEPEYESPIMRLTDQIIIGSFEVLTKVGGYIILFSTLAGILQDIPILPTLPKLILIGTLEITTGIEAITQSALPYTQKIILCCQITAFGGLSALAQAKSVLESTGLSLFQYFLCKLLSAFLIVIPLLYIL